nr:2778_t:CDS:2 [Entrophospora candida]
MKLMLWSLHLRDIKETGSDIFIGTPERLHDLIVDRNTRTMVAEVTDSLNEIVWAVLRNPARVVVKNEDVVSKDEQRILTILHTD